MAKLDFSSDEKKAWKARLAREKKKAKQQKTPPAVSQSFQQNSSGFQHTSQTGQPKTTKESFQGQNPAQPQGNGLHQSESEGFTIPVGLLYAIGGLILLLIGFLIACFFCQDVPVIIY